MAQLSKVLASIMCDVVSAQHEANLYAFPLSSLYRDKAGIAAPAVSFADIELTLHCAFGESSDSSLEVIIAAEELAKLPPECIQSLQMKIAPSELIDNYEQRQN